MSIRAARVAAGCVGTPPATVILSLLPSHARVFGGIGQLFQTLSLKDGFEFSQQRRMNKTIGCHSFPAVELKSSSTEVAHHSAGLLYEQHAGCGIPGIQIEFPESIKPTAGYVTKIERCRTRTPYSMTMQRDLVIKKDVRIFMPLVAGKPRGQQRLCQIRNL